MVIQKKLHFNRIKNSKIHYQKGANWFSIRHSTACYVLKEYKNYKKMFAYSFCADEIFLQTILVNSSFSDCVVDNNLRYIDWERGQPYVFRIEDYDLLMNSGKLFARKFNIDIDSQIILKIYKSLTSVDD